MKLRKSKKTVLIIPDTQLPFEHQDAIAFLTAVKKKYKPDVVVHIGDFWDLHALSDYVINPDGLGVSQEYSEALKRSQAFYKLFPKVELIIGNHDIRMYKRAAKAGIPKAYLRDYKEWMGLPKGWTAHERVVVDDVLYIHGEGFSGHAGHRSAAVRNMQSTVMGHIHSHAGIAYLASHEQLIFGMNVGCLIDNHAYAFEYGKHLPYKPILGCGIVQKGVPIFEPMVMSRGGRWIKDIK